MYIVSSWFQLHTPFIQLVALHFSFLSVRDCSVRCGNKEDVLTRKPVLSVQ